MKQYTLTTAVLFGLCAATSLAVTLNGDRVHLAGRDVSDTIAPSVSSESSLGSELTLSTPAPGLNNATSSPSTIPGGGETTTMTTNPALSGPPPFPSSRLGTPLYTNASSTGPTGATSRPLGTAPAPGGVALPTGAGAGAGAYSIVRRFETVRVSRGLHPRFPSNVTTTAAGYGGPPLVTGPRNATALTASLSASRASSSSSSSSTSTSQQQTRTTIISIPPSTPSRAAGVPLVTGSS